jgi:CheY-like chemotaxis protein
MSRSILMLEHDDDDRYITQAVFDEQRYDVKINFVSSAEEFFQYLERVEKDLPSLILLNYYATPVNAVEVLKRLKQNEVYRRIPAVVLSGSVKSEIIEECYASGATSFIQKPSKASEAEAKIKSFFHYWFETVHLP